MKKSNILALAVVSLVALSGCQTNEPKKDMSASVKESTPMKMVQVTKADATKAGAEQAIAAAEKAKKKAASVSGEWRDTGKFIKQAKAAMKKGDFKKAVKLANKAEHEGHSGYQQAVSQKQLRMPAYLQTN